MSSPDRHSQFPPSPFGTGRDQHSSPQLPVRQSSPMLQESPNPEMFTASASSGGRRRPRRRTVAAVGVLVVAALIAVGVWWGTSGRGDTDGADTASHQTPTTAAVPATANPATETPGAMVPYRDGVPDGMDSPSQTIQSFTRAFYELRSTPDAMQYFAPGVPYTEQFVGDNIKNTVPGTKFNLFMFPAEPDKLANKKPLGTEPQVWLVTLILTLPDSKTYVASQQYMTVKVDGKYKIQEWGTLSS